MSEPERLLWRCELTTRYPDTWRIWNDRNGRPITVDEMCRALWLLGDSRPELLSLLELVHVRYCRCAQSMHLDPRCQTLRVALTEGGPEPQGGQPISWDLRAGGAPASSARFILNARVNTAPRTLEAIVRQTIATAGTPPPPHSELTFLECFSPLPPQPTYRLLTT